MSSRILTSRGGLAVACSIVAITLLVCGSNRAFAAPGPSLGTTPAGTSALASNAPAPASTCNSAYDTFYGSQPGVTSYWALCEGGANPSFSDSVGSSSLPAAGITGTLTGGATGPVGDGETAVQALASTAATQGQGIALNSNAGSIAMWINADGSPSWVPAVAFQAVGLKSGISLGTFVYNGSLCLMGNWTASDGNNSNIQQCGFTPNAWHRVVMAWGGSFMSLAIDGQVKTVAMYHGALDNAPFSYQLFSGCCASNKQMTLAKVLLSSQSWSGTQVAQDFAPPTNILAAATSSQSKTVSTCKSAYDTFYGSQPGVTSYWALCEGGANPSFSDSVGSSSLPAAGITGTLTGGATGPVGDGETAVQALASTAATQGQGIALNSNAGSIAMWINADGSPSWVPAVAFQAVGLKSGISLGTFVYNGSLCLMGNWTASDGNNSNIQQCGFTPNAWHRVVMAWGGSFMSLAIDGQVKTVAMYHGALDNAPFSYQLFSGCCASNKQMTLAKVLLSSQSWSGTQVAQDFAPPTNILAAAAAAATPTAPTAPVPAQLVFNTQPANTTTGSTINPAVTVQVQDASGNIMPAATNAVVLSLAPNPANAVLSGTPTASASNGLAQFSNLSVVNPGAGYQLVASSQGLPSVTSASFAVTPPISASPFLPLPLNTCSSPYDSFYSAEPGVYAFWALCESGPNPGINDYVGQWSLAGGWGSGPINGGVPGPVPDGETAVQAATATASVENQDFPLNANAGTLATWINADAWGNQVAAVWFSAINRRSGVSITVNSNGNSICYYGNFQNSGGTSYSVSQCGFPPNTWHRVAFVWTGGSLALAVDGVVRAGGTYTGTLDNMIFYYRLFPSCCDTGKQMTLAKAIVSNQAWSAAQLALDFAPVIITPPAGGVYVSTQPLGTIHRDVLGFSDNNQDISSPAQLSALKTGLAAGGFTAVRYAGGFGGITADLGDWQHGSIQCGQNAGVTAPAQNLGTTNFIDNYVPQVAQPLGLHLGYTVNYGTNPPLCNAGGDPVVNAGNLVNYLNNTKHYGFKYFEVGNEQYSTGSETDMHPNPQTGASYVAYEPAFYNAMKAKDPTIQVGIPFAGAGDYAYQTGFDLPVLAGAKYDAVVFHAYPISDPVTDRSTLYQDRTSSTAGIRGALLTVQTELLNAGKSAEAIWITEWSGSVAGNQWSRQTIGAITPLFVATELAEYMQAGVQYATWWGQGGTDVCSTLNYDGNGESAYSWWGCGETAVTYTGPMAGVAEVPVGMKPGDLTPAGRGFQVLSQSGFVTEGEHMLHTQPDLGNAPWLASYAATHNGSYAVILINRDRDTAHTVPVKLAGKAQGATVTQWTYGRAQYDQSYFGNWSVAPTKTTLGAWTGTFPATLPPWSVSVLVFGN